MAKVTILSHTLKLKGHSKTLALAEKHNQRLIAAEIGSYGKINPQKSVDNVQLVPLVKSLEDTVFDVLRSAGLDLKHFSYQKKNRVFAREFLFTVTAGHKCDFNAMYKDALTWLKGYLPECPVVHAVIHHDEDIPHMHVILVPLCNGKLQADEVRGYKGVTNLRNKSLFNFLDSHYGLTFPVNLKGNDKKAGAVIAIKHFNSLPDSEIRMNLAHPIEQAIYARPEPFLAAFGVTVEELKRLQNNSTG